MTSVLEITAYLSEHEGTPEEVAQRLIANGWLVAEEPEGKTVLVHDLIPGAQRIIIHP